MMDSLGSLLGGLQGGGIRRSGSLHVRVIVGQQPGLQQHHKPGVRVQAKDAIHI